MEIMSRRLDTRYIPVRPNFAFEKKLWKADLRRIAGLDEAGRGALAGPVVAGAVVFASDGKAFRILKGVRDSKEMSTTQRERWADKIQRTAAEWAIGRAEAEEIDRWGIVPATRLAMQRALGGLHRKAEHLLVDALVLPEVDVPQGNLIKGDRRSLSIAAASVLAKVYRDTEMRKLDTQFPGYGLSQHKGYGTAMHRKRILALGASRIHRHCFNLSGPESSSQQSSDLLTAKGKRK